MIVKMKFINISGPRGDIDRVTDLYLSRYEIQLESALSELKTVDNLRPFVEINPYREVLNKAIEFVGYLPNADDVTPDTSLGLDDMFELVRKANEDYQNLQEKKEKLRRPRSFVPNSRTSRPSAPWTATSTGSCSTTISPTASAGSPLSFTIRCRSISWMTWVPFS